MRSHMATQTIPELVSVVANKFSIDTTTAFVEATEMKEKLTQSVLEISNLVGI